MSLRLGYACVNETLKAKKIRANRRAIKKTFHEKGMPHISNLVNQNLDDLLTILKWNVENNIQVFRMSSDITPWGSEYEFDELPNWPVLKEKFERAGLFAKENNIRLSFHPGQFCCLGSAKEKVVLNAISDLELHGRIMDALLQPRSRLAKINIHLGGAYGDKPSAVARFIKNYGRLSEAVTTRLTLENDDRLNLYSVKDLYEMVYLKTGIPIVFDYHHHNIHPDGLSEIEGLKLACSTWQVKPCTHYSESARLERSEKTPLRAHSRFIYSKINDHGMDIDCVVEAKGKELAVLRHREMYGMEA